MLLPGDIPLLQNANLTMACQEVISNKGAGGVDGMQVEELKQYLDEHRQRLTQQIRNCQYHAQLNALDGWLRNRLRYCIWHH